METSADIPPSPPPPSLSPATAAASMPSPTSTAPPVTPGRSTPPAGRGAEAVLAPPNDSLGDTSRAERASDLRPQGSKRGHPNGTAFYPSRILNKARPRPSKPSPAPITTLWGKPLTVHMVRTLQKHQAADLLEAGFLARRTLEGAVFRERQLVHRGVKVRRIYPHPGNPIIIPTKFTGPTSSYLNIPVEQDVCRLYEGYPGTIPHRFTNGQLNQTPHAPVISLPLAGDAKEFHPRTGFFVYRHPLRGISGPPGTLQDAPPRQPPPPPSPHLPALRPSLSSPSSPDEPSTPRTPKQRLNPHCPIFKPSSSLPLVDWVDFEPADHRFNLFAEQRWIDSDFDMARREYQAFLAADRLLPPFEIQPMNEDWHPEGSDGLILAQTPFGSYAIADTEDGPQVTTPRYRLATRPARVREVRLRYRPWDRRGQSIMSRALPAAEETMRTRAKSMENPPTTAGRAAKSGHRVSSLDWKFIDREMLARPLCRNGFR